jgi:hypothetical protein
MMASAEKRTPRKRDHHYTPVRYLQNFTDGEGVLHVISCTDGHRWESSPDGIGFQRDLYAPDDLADGEDPNKYEDAFCAFEGAAVPVMKDIIERRAMPTDLDALGMLFNFIAFQAVRVPATRKMIAAPREHTARIIMDLLQSDRSLYESEARQAGYNLDEFPFERIGQGSYEPRLTTEGFLDDAMTMINAMLPYIARRSWTVLYSDRPAEQFIVCDDPVALTWWDGRRTRIGPGHGHLRTDLTFPLSSSVALLGRYDGFAPVIEASRENVAAINSKTVMQARRFVAASSEQFVLMRRVGEIVDAETFIADIQASRG